MNILRYHEATPEEVEQYKRELAEHPERFLLFTNETEETEDEQG